MDDAAHPRFGLHAGRPFLTLALAAKRLVTARPRLVAAGVGLAIATIAVAVFLPGAESRAASIVLDSREVLQPPMWVTTKETPPSRTDPLRRYPIPSVHGTPLPEVYASLVEWTHPVVGAERKLPLLPTGHYGAERSGVLRVRCGEGHCGADLDGPRGRPILAVTSGVVHEIERSRNGKDGRSGRYVRIEHDDGVLTSYMHLDSIVATLEIGMRVDGGQQIGTLGATGVRAANPHLHFALEVPKVAGTHGRRASLRYVDPAPFLMRADVRDPSSLPAAPERHPGKRVRSAI